MSAFGGTGRPTGAEIRVKTRELVRLLADGEPLGDASVKAGLSPARVVRLFDSDEFFQLYAAIRAGTQGPTVVVLEAALDAAA